MKKKLLLCTILLSISAGAFAMEKKKKDDKADQSLSEIIKIDEKKSSPTTSGNTQQNLSVSLESLVDTDGKEKESVQKSEHSLFWRYTVGFLLTDKTLLKNVKEKEKKSH